MKMLITGGAGFIGCNFVHEMIGKYDHDLVIFDKLTYAANPEYLDDVKDKIEFVKGDIGDSEAVNKVMKDCDMVVNFAAEMCIRDSINNRTNDSEYWVNLFHKIMPQTLYFNILGVKVGFFFDFIFLRLNEIWRYYFWVKWIFLMAFLKTN